MSIHTSIIHPKGQFDNAARDYEHIEAVPLSAAMGAEIKGVEISAITDDQFKELEDALYRHKMIFLMDQQLTHTHQEALTLRFGDFGIDAYTKGTEGHENVQPVIKEANTRTEMIFGSGWHTDSPFLETPPAISMLYGVDIPPYGGDTIWCNSTLAYRFLSPTMRQLLEPLKVHMSAREVVAILRRMNARSDGLEDKEPGSLGNMELDVNTREMIEGSMHPLVRTHPETGEKSLYVDQTYSKGIEGMTDAEAQPILDFLVRHITQPVFSCRLRWRPNTFVIWDNRLCVHQAFNDYDGFRREMYRTTVLGERPQ